MVATKKGKARRGFFGTECGEAEKLFKDKRARTESGPTL